MLDIYNIERTASLILDHFDRNTKRVLEFWRFADERIYGRYNWTIDAVIDAIDAWLIAQWMNPGVDWEDESEYVTLGEWGNEMEN